MVRLHRRLLKHSKSIVQDIISEKRASRLELNSVDIPGADSYRGLDRSSLALVGAKPRSGLPSSVNLLLPRLRADGLFAGTRTALDLAMRSCQILGRPLRIIVTDSRFSSAHRAEAKAQILRDFGPISMDITLWTSDDLFANSVGESDLWIATHWTTAHAADVASRIGVLAPSQVIYLVQDYEPGFTPWSTQHAIASATYHAGFQLIVNSTPLAHYLHELESLEIQPEHVFRPQLDLDRLAEAAQERSESAEARILFYGRPSKPRNLFQLGVSTLRIATSELERLGCDHSIRSVGEGHLPVALSASTRLSSLGTLGWSQYFVELAQADVMLSLQYSPHPSHPPLDAVVSGMEAVTNEFGGIRGSLSERLHVGPADPDELAQLLVRAVLASSGRGAQRFDDSVVEKLGHPLPFVLESSLHTWQRGEGETTTKRAISDEKRTVPSHLGEGLSA